MYQEADWMALGPTTYAIHVTGMSTRCSVKSVCSVCTVFPVVSHPSRRTESGNWEREPANPPKKKSCLSVHAGSKLEEGVCRCFGVSKVRSQLGTD